MSPIEGQLPRRRIPLAETKPVVLPEDAVTEFAQPATAQLISLDERRAHKPPTPHTAPAEEGTITDMKTRIITPLAATEEDSWNVGEMIDDDTSKLPEKLADRQTVRLLRPTEKFTAILPMAEQATTNMPAELSPAGSISPELREAVTTEMPNSARTAEMRSFTAEQERLQKIRAEQSGRQKREQQADEYQSLEKQRKETEAKEWFVLKHKFSIDLLGSDEYSRGWIDYFAKNTETEFPLGSPHDEKERNVLLLNILEDKAKQTGLMSQAQSFKAYAEKLVYKLAA